MPEERQIPQERGKEERLPCTFTYKDGRQCDGQLSIENYKISSGRVFYVTLLCDKKSNHGMSYPGNAPFASEWGYDQEEIARKFLGWTE